MINKAVWTIVIAEFIVIAGVYTVDLLLRSQGIHILPEIGQVD